MLIYIYSPRRPQRGTHSTRRHPALSLFFLTFSSCRCCWSLSRRSFSFLRIAIIHTITIEKTANNRWQVSQHMIKRAGATEHPPRYLRSAHAQHYRISCWRPRCTPPRRRPLLLRSSGSGNETRISRETLAHTHAAHAGGTRHLPTTTRMKAERYIVNFLALMPRYGRRSNPAIASQKKIRRLSNR